ncbi:MAG: hypothetical protein EOO42_03490 [Flavobacteriales bacterium]|nr:MAG: hypothetical protein EOO42_03490 [Flavobacteriales bacterium]
MHNDSKSKSQKIFEIFIATTAWFALVLQFVIMKDSAINFFSYFTILSNLLVAVGVTIPLIAAHAKVATLVSSASTKTALALYIFIVGLIYNLVLRGIWEPKGWQLVADNLLHVIVPILYIIYWLSYPQKTALKYAEILKWFYFPIAYLAYSLIRGHLVKWYPYPFLNVTEFGYQQVLINAGFVVITFTIIASILIAINRWLSRKEKTNV